LGASPFAGIVLIVEITDPYAPILPLFVACVAAYAVAVRETLRYYWSSHFYAGSVLKVEMLT
jgi:H+/Cl- antiporter ClcA